MTAVSPAVLPVTPPAPEASTPSQPASPDAFRTTLDSQIAVREAARTNGSTGAHRTRTPPAHGAPRPAGRRADSDPDNDSADSAQSGAEAGVAPQIASIVDPSAQPAMLAQRGFLALANGATPTGPTVDSGAPEPGPDTGIGAGTWNGPSGPTDRSGISLVAGAGFPAPAGLLLPADPGTPGAAPPPAVTTPTGGAESAHPNRGPGDVQAASPSSPDSPASAMNLAEALAADTSAGGTSAADTSTPGTTTATTPSVAPTPNGAVAASTTPGGPDANGPGGVLGAMPTGAGPTSGRSQPVTPATITASAASEVVRTAADAATSTLLSAAGATPPPLTDLSPTAGSPAVVTAAALPSHVAELARMARISADGTARLTVRLDPPELGAVTLHIISRGSAVEMSLRAETPEGAAALSGQQARVRDVLAGHGFDLSRFSIAGDSARAAAGQQGGPGDSRQRDSSGGDGRPGESRFSTDTGADGRAGTRPGSAGSDGSAGGGRSGSRSGDRWSPDISPTQGVAAPASADTEGTWL
jgi:hypothetical protein